MTFRMKTIPYCTGCTTKIQQNFDITKGQGTGKFYSLQPIFFISRSFHYYWGRENRVLYRGLRYVEVCYHSRFEFVSSSFDIMQIKKLQYFMFLMKIILQFTWCTMQKPRYLKISRFCIVQNMELSIFGVRSGYKFHFLHYAQYKKHDI